MYRLCIDQLIDYVKFILKCVSSVKVLFVKCVKIMIFDMGLSDCPNTLKMLAKY
jgi:hypothetical protein